MESTRSPIVIGAGPAGLTAALSLAKRGVTPHVIEATGSVGGLARTPRVGDWRVDPGGHRFFTRSEVVLDLWDSLLAPDQWITAPRRSAMLVGNQYVNYPLAGRDLLTQLGFRAGLYGLGSLVLARARHRGRPIDEAASFREWGTREFGRFWYTVFFDGYVRKTWLAEPDEIPSEWANQRIKPISWRVRRRRASPDLDVFRYPRLGPGQVWEAAAAALTGVGVQPTLNSPVVELRFDGGTWMAELLNGDVVSGDAVFSSMPLGQLIEALRPPVPEDIRAAAATLKHRGLITVAVALEKRVDIPYHWVYTSGRAFHAGRIQNYGRWSSSLAPEHWGGTYLGFEYFAGPEAGLMAADDQRMEDTVREDLRALGIDDPAVKVVMTVRSAFAYPVDGGDDSVGRIRDYLRREYPSLHPIGRNGMHHYDNQDHAMLTAMQSVGRYFGENVDPWQVNVDRGYHEAGLLKR